MIGGRLLWAAMLLALLAPGASAQTDAPTEAECQQLRRRIAGQALLSAAVRGAVAARAAPPAAAAAPASPAQPRTRLEEIRARLEQVSDEQRRLEDQRIGAVMRLDFAGAGQIQRRLDALEKERAALEGEQAGLPATAPPQPAPAPAPPAAAPPAPDIERVPCAALPALSDETLRIRRRELGVVETQPGAIPLLPLAGQERGAIADELGVQLGAWPESATRVGLLDQNGDGRLDGLVDVPIDGLFRLYRQRADGTLSVDVFVRPGGPTADDLARRLEEMRVRRLGRSLTQLLVQRPAGPVRTVAETEGFETAWGHLVVGDWAALARGELAARSREFENARGERVRALDVVAPGAGGVVLRRVTVNRTPSGEEVSEETTTTIVPQTYWRVDVEVLVRGQTRSAAGSPVGAPAVTGPVRFTLER